MTATLQSTAYPALRSSSRVNWGAVLAVAFCAAVWTVAGAVFG